MFCASKYQATNSNEKVRTIRLTLSQKFAVSGEAPEQPVVSVKSGNVFEKRLIEKYIADHGKDPVSGEELTLEDLVEIKARKYFNTY